MAQKDYYAILGINRNASDKDIKQAYRKLARKHHPDVNPGDKSAGEKFKEINAAFEVLSNPEKRKKYDQFGENWQHADQFNQSSGGFNAPPEGFHWQSNTGGFGGFDFNDLSGMGNEDILESILGGFGKRSTSRRPRQGQDIEYPLEITLEEAFSGTSRIIQIEEEIPCPTCKGSGKIANAICGTCRGVGRVRTPRRLEVKIPAGVDNGSRVRIAGKGGAGRNGGSPGDLYLLVSVAKHYLFERQGDNLITEVPVPFLTAILGGEVEVPTPKGKLSLKIPPESQNGQIFRLAKQGMPHLNNAARGDLLAKLKVVLPRNISERERKIFEELKSLGSN